MHPRSEATKVKRLIGVCSFLGTSALVVASLHAGAQERRMPDLGSPVPGYVLRARSHSDECITDINHRDPRAQVKVDEKLFTIAWDVRTKAVAYIFTDDRRLVTDSELSVGGSCRLLDQAGQPYEIVNYMDWAITPKWADTVRDLSGDAVWYAALRKETSQPKYGKIVGFVQSRYLKVAR